MKYVDIPFGPYLPDLGGVPNANAPGYLVDALNFRRTENGYRGMPTFTDVTSPSALPGAGVSLTDAHGVAVRSLTNGLHFFVVVPNGTLSESRDEGDSAWQNVTPAAGAAIAEEGDFIRFGDDVIYVYFTRAPIVKDLTAALATQFTDLAGSPPTARCGAVIRQHVVLGALSTDPYAIRTSAIDNHEDWPTPGTADARSKQSIQESLNPAFGEISRILGGEKFGIICQRYALTRMTYVGGSAVYEFDTYERTLGVANTFSAYPVTDGRLWYFSNEGGIFATDGYSVQSISHGKIDDSIYQNLISHPDGAIVKLQYESVFDARRRLLIFGMGDLATGRKDIVYDLSTGSFSLTNDQTRTALFSAIRDISSSIVSCGRHVYTASSTTGFLRRLTGSATTGALQTGYLELEPGYRVQIQKAHLLGTGVPGSLTISYKTAASLANVDTLQTGFTAMTAVSRGEGASARVDAPYVAFRVTGTGAESQLIRGIRIFYEKTSQI